jgi:hypothetical protein
MYTYLALVYIARSGLNMYLLLLTQAKVVVPFVLHAGGAEVDWPKHVP